MSAALARLGICVAVVATGLYGVNQAVDAVANKFVAQAWVDASPADQPVALRIAEAIRHLEIGLGSVWTLSVGISLLLFGVALGLGHSYPRVLGWGAIAISAGLFAGALNLANNGFTIDSAYGYVGAAAGSLMGVWILVLAVFLWRQASKPLPGLPSPFDA